MMKASDAGRRRAKRVPVELDGTLAGRREVAVRVLDLSLSGCLVRCSAALDPGAIYDLELPLPGPSLSAKVRVVESSVDGAVDTSASARFLAGLQFLGLAAREETRLRAFLHQEWQRRRREDAPAH